MAIMKQMQECLERTLQDRDPIPSRKWKGLYGYRLGHPAHWIFLYHYQHLVLVYDPINHKYLYEWWERPTDKRGLESAKEFFEAKWKEKQKNIC